MSSIYLGHVKDQNKRSVSSSGGMVRAIFEHALLSGFVDKVWIVKCPNTVITVDKSNIADMWTEGSASIYRRIRFNVDPQDGAFLLPCQSAQRCKLKISPVCGGVLDPQYIKTLGEVVTYRDGMWPGLNLRTVNNQTQRAYKKDKTELACKKCKLVECKSHMLVLDPWELLQKTPQPGWTLLKLQDPSMQWLVEQADIEFIKLKPTVWASHIDKFKAGHKR